VWELFTKKGGMNEKIYQKLGKQAENDLRQVANSCRKGCRYCWGEKGCKKKLVQAGTSVAPRGNIARALIRGAEGDLI